MSAILAPVHFMLLAAAIAVLLLMHLIGWNASAWGVSSAINGALHAAAVAGSLRRPSSRFRQAAFVGIAAIFSYWVPFLGVALMSAFDVFAFPLAAAIGALFYVMLIRHFWLRTLTAGNVCLIAFLCAVATWIGAAVYKLGHLIGADFWMTISWWLACSTTLVLATSTHRSLER